MEDVQHVALAVELVQRPLERLDGRLRAAKEEDKEKRDVR